MENRYEENELKDIVKECKSIAGVCRKLGIRPIGGNYKTLKIKFLKWNIDISHFTGKGWRTGNSKPVVSAPKLEDVLVENSVYNSNRLRKRLILEGYKENKCEQCGLSLWNGKQIPLELEHVNGNNLDNRIENLKILCCNCHAQTDTYRGKSKLSARSERNEVEFRKFKESLTGDADTNLEPSFIRNNKEGAETLHGKSKSRKSSKIIRYCKKCQKVLNDDNVYCSKECHEEERRSKIPTIPQLIDAFEKYHSFLQVGKFFNVSDNAIRKWVDRFDIWDMIKKKSSAQTEINSGN